jgi:hypothetical protein
VKLQWPIIEGVEGNNSPIGQLQTFRNNASDEIEYEMIFDIQ